MGNFVQDKILGRDPMAGTLGGLLITSGLFILGMTAVLGEGVGRGHWAVWVALGSGIYAVVSGVAMCYLNRRKGNKEVGAGSH
jgi:hypothetical protein